MSIQVDQASLERTITALRSIKNGAPRAITRSLNTGATRTKTLTGKRIRANVRLPARYVSDRITVKKATFDRQTAHVRTPRRGLLLSYFLVQSASQPLARYNPTWGRMVVTPPTGAIKTRIPPTGVLHTWGPGVFIMRFPNGQFGLMVRERGAGTQGSRLKTLYGPSLSQVMNTLRDEIIDPEAQNIVASELDRQVKLLLGELP